MEDRPVTRSQTRSQTQTSSQTQSKKRSRVETKETVDTTSKLDSLILMSEEERDILNGLTLDQNGHIVVDENLLSRLNPEPEPEQRIMKNPFEDCPMFISTIRNGTPLTLDFLEECSDYRKMNPDSVKMGEIIGNLPIDWLALKNSTMLEDNWDYSVKIPLNPRPTDQFNTGRCWKMAFLNLLRYPLIKKLNLEHKFEFSETYLYFYDKVERSNLFLEYIWTFREHDLQDRQVRMFTEPGAHFLSDGGCYNYAVSLVKKYGLVPKNVYGESFNSKVSSYMNETLVRVLNHMALEIFHNQDWSRSQFEKKKEEYMTIIYDLVVKFLGEPPKPTDKFTWTYKDEVGETHKVPNVTAEKFYNIIVPHEDETKMVIINDPRKPETYYMPSFSEYSTNMIGGQPSAMINLPMNEFKEIVCASLKNEDPVWMACDMGKCFDIEANTSDVNRFDYNSVLGTNVEHSKADMLDMLTSTPNHAMIFNGVDTNENLEGEVLSYNKWRIENSWGKSDGDEDSSPDHSCHRMSDAYVDKYVYMGVVDLKYFPQKITEKIMSNSQAGISYTYKATDAFGTLSLKADCKHCLGNKTLTRPK